MKTEIINQEQEVQTEWDFPCLGKSKYTELVVLFKEYEIGTVLIHDKQWDLGWYSKTWSMEAFTPITETTTIKFTK